MKIVPRHCTLTLNLPGDVRFPFIPVMHSISDVVGKVLSGEPFLVSFPADVVKGVPIVFWPHPGTGSFSLGDSKIEMSLDWKDDVVFEQRVMEVCTQLTERLAVAHTIAMQRISAYLKCEVQDGLALDAFAQKYCNPTVVGDIQQIQMSWKTLVDVHGSAFERWIRYVSNPRTKLIDEMAVEYSTPSSGDFLVGNKAVDAAKAVLSSVWREASGIDTFRP